MNIKDITQLERGLNSNEFIAIENNKVFVFNRNTKKRKFIGNLTSGIPPIEIDNNSELFHSTSFSGLISLNSVPDDYNPEPDKKPRKKRRSNTLSPAQLMRAAFADTFREISVKELNKKKRGRPKKKEKYIFPDVVPDNIEKVGYNYMPTKILEQVKKLKDAEGDFSI